MNRLPHKCSQIRSGLLFVTTKVDQLLVKLICFHLGSQNVLLATPGFISGAGDGDQIAYELFILVNNQNQLISKPQFVISQPHSLDDFTFCLQDFGVCHLDFPLRDNTAGFQLFRPGYFLCDTELMPHTPTSRLQCLVLYRPERVSDNWILQSSYLWNAMVERGHTLSCGLNPWMHRQRLNDQGFEIHFRLNDLLSHHDWDVHARLKKMRQNVVLSPGFQNSVVNGREPCVGTRCVGTRVSIGTIFDTEGSNMKTGNRCSRWGCSFRRSVQGYGYLADSRLEQSPRMRLAACVHQATPQNHQNQERW